MNKRVWIGTHLLLFLHLVFIPATTRLMLTDAIATIDETQTSDNDGGERPVRRKLKETSITSAPQSLNPANAEESQHGRTNRASSRGRKRSFNEDEEENIEEDASHRRKRSRSSNVEEEIGKVQNNLSSKIMSPQKKRSRDQLDKEEPKTEGAAGKKVAENSAENEAKPAAEGEPEKKRHRDDSQEREPVSYSAFH